METKRKINHYRPIKNLDTEERNYIMKDKLYKFLMGLNLEYEALVNQIIAQEIVLDIEEAIALARQEENTRSLRNDLKTKNAAFSILKSKDTSVLKRGIVKYHSSKEVLSLIQN
ncbi:unnamed protein product [Spirodela intermedia]|uniref:Uncharacterized protein n=1 Tax=Spirodela intermedia TaxID=51605 RepID=A0A7I8KUC0_SPIIN|nr:unnamed protein product [Spirodela intermedia]